MGILDDRCDCGCETMRTNETQVRCAKCGHFIRRIDDRRVQVVVSRVGLWRSVQRFNERWPKVRRVAHGLV